MARQGVRLPKPPDWLVYSTLVVVLLFAALSQRGKVGAPAPAPPLPAGDGKVLAAASPFDPAVVVRVRPRTGDEAGTAFSVADSGVWITARHVVENCPRAALMVTRTEGVEAKVRLTGQSETALLTTEGGAPALPISTGPLRRGETAYEPGYPHDRPGEVATRLLGREMLYLRGRRTRTVPVLVWAEVGRTQGLRGALAGLSGAPVLDREGRVIAVTVGEAPRRGRIYTTTPEALREALSDAGVARGPTAGGEPLTASNYGLAADGLRRALRVAQVVCVTK